MSASNRKPQQPAKKPAASVAAAVPLTLQFIGGYGLVSDAIEWMSLGPLSHVDAVADDGWLVGCRSDCCHAPDGSIIEPGLRRRPPGYFGRARIVVRMTLEVTPVQYSAYWAWLNARQGAAYNLEAIAGMVLERQWNASRRFFCSQAQGLAGEHAQVLLPLYVPSNRLTPVELALAWSVRGAKQVQDNG